MDMEYRSSTLISIFKRKGAEGQFTKIVDENSGSQYHNLLSSLEQGEKGVIIYYKKDAFYWLLLTNKRVLTSSNIIILNSDIIDVSPAFQDEFNDGISSRKKFTRLMVRDRNSKIYNLSIEMGNPYEGFYQVLHFIANSNKHA